jgi:hypothetical protein
LGGANARQGGSDPLGYPILAAIQELETLARSPDCEAFSMETAGRCAWLNLQLEQQMDQKGAVARRIALNVT